MDMSLSWVRASQIFCKEERLESLEGSYLCFWQSLVKSKPRTLILTVIISLNILVLHGPGNRHSAYEKK